MKASIRFNSPLFLFLFFSAPFLLMAQKPVGKDSLPEKNGKREFLEMRGIVKSAKTSAKGSEFPLDSVIVCIFGDTSKPALLTIFGDKKGKADFRLPFNKKFTITVSRRGYVTKILEVNTKIPANKREAYLFPFSVDLFKDVYEVDFSILKRPIGKVTFNTNASGFDYDYTYTDRVNAQLKGVYKDYFLLEEVVDSSGKPDVVVPKDVKKKNAKGSGSK